MCFIVQQIVELTVSLAESWTAILILTKIICYSFNKISVAVILLNSDSNIHLNHYKILIRFEYFIELHHKWVLW